MHLIRITNRRHERSPLDPKLRLTIFAIIEEFFEVNGHDTMLYLADTGDRKQAFRNRLKDNPNLPKVLEEFDETISFLFDPPEEPAWIIFKDIGGGTTTTYYDAYGNNIGSSSDW